MSIGWNILRVVIVAVTVVTTSEISRRWPRLGALLLSLPIVSILAFLLGWFQHGDLGSLARMSRETLVLVPLGLPLFVPLAFADRLGIGFWTALIAGILMASGTIGLWMWWNPFE
jgi:hypothetical protein